MRELENLIERAVLLAPSGEHIEVEQLFPGTARGEPLGAALDRQGQLGNVEEARREQLYERLLDEHFDLQAHETRLLELAVRRAGGNLTQAARLLGITRRQLAYRLKQADAACGAP